MIPTAFVSPVVVIAGIILPTVYISPEQDRYQKAIKTVLHTLSLNLGAPPVKANGLEAFPAAPAPSPKPNMIKPPRPESAVSCTDIRGRVVEPICSPSGPSETGVPESVTAGPSTDTL